MCSVRWRQAASCSRVSSRLAFRGALSKEDVRTDACSSQSPEGLARAMHWSPSSSFAIGGCVNLPKIAITIGDPAGVGAEVALKALADPALLGAAEWTLVGDDLALEAVQPGYRKRFDSRVRLVLPGLLDPS